MNNMVRLFVIAGAVACAVVIVALGMARHDADLLAPFNLMVFALGVAVYLFPSWFAMYRDCKSTAGIIIVNLLLGWTVFGWFAALGWAAAGKVSGPDRLIPKSPAHPVPGH
jgi:hypothetical protein